MDTNLHECPECGSRATVQISDEQFECNECGEIFVVTKEAA
jgi:ribosomal protein L37AE/L43A